MGVYIKGMEMPTHCMDCPFMVSRDNDDCILQSAEANESFENWEQMKVGCPLVPVPPHGRLIDADKIYDAVEQRYRISSGIEHRCERDLLDLICSAPTILEAEEGET